MMIYFHSMTLWKGLTPDTKSNTLIDILPIRQNNCQTAKAQNFQQQQEE